MKEIYIHIGTPKTGTTAIQRYLSHNRSALAKAGWCYPEAGMNRADDPVAHHQLAWSFIRRDHFELDGLLGEVEAYGSNRILLSSEFFWGARSPKSIERFFSGCTVKIIVYFRRQDDFLLSYFKQDVKTGLFGGTLRAFQARLERRNRLDYYAFCEEWASIFGYENIVVRVYDPEKSVIDSFVDALGIAQGAREPEVIDINRSIDSRFVGTMRAAIQLRAEGLDEKLYEQLVDAIRNHKPSAAAGKEGRHYSLMNHRERLALLERYRESNELLAEKYMNGARFPVAKQDLNEAKISDAFILPELFKEVLRVAAQWQSCGALPDTQ